MRLLLLLQLLSAYKGLVLLLVATQKGPHIFKGNLSFGDIEVVSMIVSQNKRTLELLRYTEDNFDSLSQTVTSLGWAVSSSRLVYLGFNIWTSLFTSTGFWGTGGDRGEVTVTRSGEGIASPNDEDDGHSC